MVRRCARYNFHESPAAATRPFSQHRKFLLVRASNMEIVAITAKCCNVNGPIIVTSSARAQYCDIFSTLTTLPLAVAQLALEAEIEDAKSSTRICMSWNETAPYCCRCCCLRSAWAAWDEPARWLEKAKVWRKIRSHQWPRCT